MKKIILFILATVIHFECIAQVPPTKASYPIPEMSLTRNKNTVMTEMIQREIKRSCLLHKQSVSAACHSGIVTLQGSVSSHKQEAEAIATAKTINGVKKVISQLTIKATH
jgi:osmotically-inducible protein OsmY